MNEKKSEELMAKYYRTDDPNLLRLLKQMARELLLLESSDWQFLITTWSARDYAENRVALHYENFNRLYSIILKYTSAEQISEGDWAFLSSLENNDGIFPELELEPFAKKTPIK